VQDTHELALGPIFNGGLVIENAVHIAVGDG
jgi:hypothetical protein